jgi:hypothetical protein
MFQSSMVILCNTVCQLSTLCAPDIDLDQGCSQQMASIGIKTCRGCDASACQKQSGPGTRVDQGRCVYSNARGGHRMYLKPIIVVSALAFATSTFAQGVSSNTPGHKMQKSTMQKSTVQKSTKSVGPGASAYSPGHKMHKAAKSTAPGASEYTPSHTTTGSATKQRY